MTSVEAAQETASAICLKGSTDILAEYFEYAVHTIIYQRGIYPSENFERTQKYGLTLFVSTDPSIKKFVNENVKRAKEWILKGAVKDLTLLMLDVKTHEVLERWNFRILEDNPGPSENGAAPVTSKKSLKVIQEEIRAVLRQITSAISFLPLLDYRCIFDVTITLKATEKAPVPEEWQKVEGHRLPSDAVTVPFRSFSTGIHRVDSGVTYRCHSESSDVDETNEADQNSSEGDRTQE